MPKLIITIEEQHHPAEDGKTLVGFATGRELQIEDGDDTSVLPQIALVLDVAISMAIQGFFQSHGVDCAHQEHSGTPLEALSTVMQREVAKVNQPFPTEL